MSIKQAIEALECAQDALDISQALQESAKSYHHPKTLAAYERVIAALAALRSRPAEPTSIKDRWNIERDGDDLLVCFNDHDKGEKCEYRRYMPAPATPHTAPVPAEPVGEKQAILAGLFEAWNREPAGETSAAIINAIQHLQATPHTEAVRMSEAWQPIETAPKDGRTLLLGYFNSAGKWRTLRGQWMSQNYIDEYWEDPEGVDPWWFETAVEADEVPNCWATEPTHWQPLPPPPIERAVLRGGEKL